MSNVVLSWSLASQKGGLTTNALWEEIQQVLEAVPESSGTVTLETADDADAKLKHLQVQTERGLSIITFGVDDGDDYDVAVT